MLVRLLPQYDICLRMTRIRICGVRGDASQRVKSVYSVSSPVFRRYFRLTREVASKRTVLTLSLPLLEHDGVERGQERWERRVICAAPCAPAFIACFLGHDRSPTNGYPRQTRRRREAQSCERSCSEGVPTSSRIPIQSTGASWQD